MKILSIFLFFQFLFALDEFDSEQILELEQKEAYSKLPQKNIFFHNPPKDNQNEMAVKFEIDKIYFLTYERLVAVFSLMNEQYNKAHQLIPQDDISQDIFEQFQQKADLFDDAKLFYELVFTEDKEIQEEFDDFLVNIKKVYIQSLTCIEIFGFKSFYKDLTSKIDNTRQDFINIKNEIELLVQKLNFFLRDAVVSFKVLLNIPDFLKDLLSPFMPLFVEEDPDPAEMDQNLMTLQRNYDYIVDETFNKIEFFQKGLSYLKTFRMKLYYKLLEFKALKENNNEFDFANQVKIVQLILINLIKNFIVNLTKKYPIKQRNIKNINTIMKSYENLYSNASNLNKQSGQNQQRNWIDEKSTEVLNSKNKLQIYYMLNKQNKDEFLEEYFQKKILKTGNDQDYQKILLKQLFNWTEDAVKLNQQNFEVIVTDNFKQEKNDISNFEFEEINLDEDIEEQEEIQHEKIQNFLQQNSKNFIQQQYEVYRQNFKRIDYSQSEEIIKIDFDNLKVDNDLFTEQSFVVSQSKYSNDQNESFDEDIIDEEILSVTTNFTLVRSKSNFGGFYQVQNFQPKNKTLKTCSTQCSEQNQLFAKNCDLQKTLNQLIKISQQISQIFYLYFLKMHQKLKHFLVRCINKIQTKNISNVEKWKQRTIQQIEKELQFQKEEFKNFGDKNLLENYLKQKKWKIEDNPNEIVTKLTKQIDDQNFKLIFYSKDPQSGIEGLTSYQDRLTMKLAINFIGILQKKNGNQLIFEGLTDSHKVILAGFFESNDQKIWSAQRPEIYIQKSEFYSGPPFEILSDNLQQKITSFITELGVDEDMCQFMVMYSKLKINNFYENYLKNMQEFFE